MSAIDWSPLWISLRTAAATIVIVFFIGVIIAWWVERLQSQSLKIFADAVITLPMVLPPTVAGFFLLYFLATTAFGPAYLSDDRYKNSLQLVGNSAGSSGNFAAAHVPQCARCLVAG